MSGVEVLGRRGAGLIPSGPIRFGLIGLGLMGLGLGACDGSTPPASTGGQGSGADSVGTTTGVTAVDSVAAVAIAPPIEAESGSNSAGVPAELLVRTDSSSLATPMPEPRPRGNSAPGLKRFPRPEHVRGIYLNAWTAGSARRRAALLALAERTEINSFVIDLKDASGYVSHRTEVPLADSVGATGEVRISNIAGVLSELETAGVYPIARIVLVKDPLLIAGRPDLAIQDTAGGVWVDSKKFVWLDMWNREVWDYHIALAREAAELGFPEIQWDYVRFPDAPRSDLDRAVISGPDGRPKADAIREFLAYARNELADLGVQVTADVFGVTTSASRDVGIGQVWESFIDQVDVALPMVYPSHYWEGSFGIDDPNGHPYEIVRWALEDALERSATVEGAGATRPWLQDFTLGAPKYGAAEVRAQIQATYDAGISEWILWNPGGRYTEGALEPAPGLPDRPGARIRVAGELVLVEDREAALARAREPVTGQAVGDSLLIEEPVTAGDSVLPARPDTLVSVDTLQTPDTLSVPNTLRLPDTLPWAVSAGLPARRR